MNLSFQLYSARNHPDFDAFLGKLSAFGYTQVEGYGGLYADPEALAAKLRSNSLVMPTGHFGLPLLRDTNKAMDIANTLGIRSLFCPAVPQEERSQPEAGWQRLRDTLAELGEAYKAAGFGFGWHNHHFEFVPTETGSLPIDIILSAENLDWQMDVAWVVRGGQNPEDWMDKYGKRITAVHVKDIAPAGQAENEDGWADVGFGTMGWDRLIRAVRSKTAAQIFVAEHDNPADAERFAARSIATTKTW